MGITGYVLLALLAVLSVYFATIYNNLVRLKHTVTKNWSNVSTLTVTGAWTWSSGTTRAGKPRRSWKTTSPRRQ
jgi:hypothetical protein